MHDFEAAVDGLRRDLGVSRVFLRLKTPGAVFPVVTESVAEGIPRVGSERDPDFSQAPTFLFISSELRPLVQDDVTATDTPPPADIVAYYGIAAQILVPVTVCGAFVGIVGIHQAGGPRAWTDEEIEDADTFGRWVGWELELEQLRERIGVSRTTVRLDVGGDPYFPIIAEAVGEGVNELRAAAGPDLRKAKTMQYLLEHRTTLVQEDLLATDTPPPPELIAQYGARSQILACISAGDRLVGFVSAHHAEVRSYTAAEIAAVEAAAAAIGATLGSREPGGR